MFEESLVFWTQKFEWFIIYGNDLIHQYDVWKIIGVSNTADLFVLRPHDVFDTLTACANQVWGSKFQVSCNLRAFTDNRILSKATKSAS